MAKRARAPRPKGESEAGFQAAILELASLRGWRSFHDQDSRRSQPGFPDLCLVRGGRVLFAELKTERGQLRQEQREWLAMLGMCSGIETYLWRPSSWRQIETVLM